MNYPTSPDGEATPADPGAIDLEPIKRRNNPLSDLSVDIVSLEDAGNLIAAVEALRERVADLMEQNTTVRRRNGEYAQAMADANEKVEAVEAREAALAGALRGLLGRLDSHFGGPLRNMDWKEQEYARNVLAATPADAMERARAVTALIEVADAVIDSGARLRSDPGTHELMLASLCSVMADLAKLDALGKEGP